MVPLWFYGILSQDDFVVPHMLSLTLVWTIVILKVGPEVTHIIDPWYKLLPSCLPHDSERDIRISSSQTNEYKKRCMPRSDNEFFSREPFEHPLHLVLFSDFRTTLPTLYHLLVGKTC